MFFEFWLGSHFLDSQPNFFTISRIGALNGDLLKYAIFSQNYM